MFRVWFQTANAQILGTTGFASLPASLGLCNGVGVLGMPAHVHLKRTAVFTLVPAYVTHEIAGGHVLGCGVSCFLCLVRLALRALTLMTLMLFRISFRRRRACFAVLCRWVGSSGAQNWSEHNAGACGAYCACRKLPLVHSRDMSHEVVFLRAFEVAESAVEGLFPRVRSHVHFEIAGLATPVRAQMAGIRFLARVDTHMHREVAPRARAVRTVGAFERLLACVHAKVGYECATRSRLVGTHRTEKVLLP